MLVGSGVVLVALALREAVYTLAQRFGYLQRRRGVALWPELPPLPDWRPEGRAGAVGGEPAAVGRTGGGAQVRRGGVGRAGPARRSRPDRLVLHGVGRGPRSRGADRGGGAGGGRRRRDAGPAGRALAHPVR